MNNLAFWARRRLLGAAIVVSMLLTACGPAPLGTSWAALSVIGEEQNILVAFNDRLLMINLLDGRPVVLRDADGDPVLDDAGNPRIWEVRGSDLGNAQFYSSPILLDETTLLVAAYSNRLFEVNIPRARVENPSGDPIVANGAAPVVADLVSSGDLLYVGLGGQNLVALSVEDRTEQWTFGTGHGIWSEPLIVDNVLYFASLDHFLYAVNADTGEALWRLDLQGAAVGAPVYAPPVEEGESGHLYMGSFARKIFDISLDGEILNEFPTHGWVWSTPTLVDGILYVADLDGWVYALDTQDDLSQVWATRVEIGAVRPSPLVSGDFVVVAGRDNKVYWLDRADGHVLTDRTRTLMGAVFADLLLIEPGEGSDGDGPMVVVSTMAPEEVLVAFDLNDGERLWTYPLLAQ